MRRDIPKFPRAKARATKVPTAMIAKEAAIQGILLFAYPF